MSQPPAVFISDLTFSYDGAPLFEQVDLTVAQKDFACIVGPNGGGKTTLLKLMLGLVSPKEGVVHVLGQPPERSRRRIGYMPQATKIDNQFPITVQEVVLTGRLGKGRWFGRYTEKDINASGIALTEVGLEDLGKRSFSSLSGGQKQRVLIARALVSDPELLLLDEPTANLDPKSESDFNRLLRRLNERLTIILVSHDIGFVSSFVRTVICVNRNVAVHPTGEIPAMVASEIFGEGKRIVLHDQSCECGAEE